MRPTLELDVIDVDTGVHHIDIHTGLQGSRRVIIPLQRAQGESRSVRHSGETPRSGKLLGDVVRVGEAIGVLVDEEGRVGSDRSSVLSLVMTEINVDDLVMLDIVDLGRRSDELQGGFAECSGITVESVKSTIDASRLVDLGDSAKVVRAADAQGL